MKILIVDDKASIRGAMRQILAGFGFSDIAEAADGEQAWQMINHAEAEGNGSGFDLVISDMEMPGMSGLELLRTTRNAPDLNTLPFIMATTVTAKQIIMETMRLGVQAYIIKPFDASVVELKLKQAGIL